MEMKKVKKRNLWARCACLRIVIGCFCLCILTLPATCRAQGSKPYGDPSISPKFFTSPGCVLGITKPHSEALLGTVASGRIARVLVEEGQVVNKGDLLVALDDELQQARVESARIQAESSVDIELAQAHVDYTERELRRLQQLHDHASDQEVKTAQQEYDYAKLELAKAKREHEKACQTFMLEQIRLKDLKIHAPFSGYVTELLRHEGETVDEQETIVSMVQLDPLDVDLDCPLHRAKDIHVGDTFRVDSTNPSWPSRIGKVVMISRVADPASQTLVVKISVPNKDGAWVSGLKVAIDLDNAICHQEPGMKNRMDSRIEGSDSERKTKTNVVKR